jgi:hypothetical protein
MAELTKEYFDEQLKAQTKELKAFAVEQTDAVARIITTAAIEDRQFLEAKLDVRARVEKLEKGLEEIRGALNLSTS